MNPLNRYLFRCCRFYPVYVIAALLLGAIDAQSATITVTNENDSGAGSLRHAIRFDASSGDTINFAPSVTTVTLTSDELVIDKNLTIAGPGANRLTVTAMYNDFVYFRIFNISSSMETVSISGITISNAFLGLYESGAGILSAGVLTLTDSTISGNYAGGFLGGGGVLNDLARGFLNIWRVGIE
jgi:hypothetical protein